MTHIEAIKFYKEQLVRGKEKGFPNSYLLRQQQALNAVIDALNAAEAKAERLESLRWYIAHQPALITDQDREFARRTLDMMSDNNIYQERQCRRDVDIIAELIDVDYRLCYDDVVFDFVNYHNYKRIMHDIAGLQSAFDTASKYPCPPYTTNIIDDYHCLVDAYKDIIKSSLLIERKINYINTDKIITMQPLPPMATAPDIEVWLESLK